MTTHTRMVRAGRDFRLTDVEGNVAKELTTDHPAIELKQPNSLNSRKCPTTAFVPGNPVPVRSFVPCATPLPEIAGKV